MLDETLLLDYAKGFFGYGNLAGPFWFIGMEEACDGSAEQIQRRLDTWQLLGRKPVNDITEFHKAFEVNEFWESAPTLQPTWSKLIRVLLAAQYGMSCERVAIASYQRDNWGRSNRETCLSELFPLPSRNVKEWIYKEHTNLEQLEGRKTYRDWAAPQRVAAIRNLVAFHKPKSVIFYGKTYQHHWESIIGAPLAHDATIDAETAKTAETVYVSMKHPTAYGVKNNYLDKVGLHIHRMLHLP